MSDPKIALVGCGGADARAVVADLIAWTQASILYLGDDPPDGPRLEARGAPPAPEALADALGGAALVIAGPVGPGPVAVARAALAARIPCLALTARPQELDALVALGREARALGIPVVAAGGLLPGVGAQLAARILEAVPDAASARVRYLRAGLTGAAAPCFKALTSAPARRFEGGRWRSLAPVTSPRRVSGPPPFERSLGVSLPGADLSGVAERWPGVTLTAELVLAPAALGLGLWAAGRMGGAGGPSSPLGRWARAALPRVAEPQDGAVWVEARARGRFATRVISLRCQDPALALGAAVGALAEALLAWAVPPGCSTPDSLDAQAWEAALRRRGLPQLTITPERHTLTSREARRLHILAP